MKTYLVKMHSDSRMGAGPDYRIMKQNELKQIKLFADFVQLYELATPRPVSKKKMKQMGMTFMEDERVDEA